MEKDERDVLRVAHLLPWDSRGAQVQGQQERRGDKTLLKKDSIRGCKERRSASRGHKNLRRLLCAHVAGRYL
jgi:hypothetical protein